MKGAEVANVAFLVTEKAVVAKAGKASARLLGFSSRNGQKPFLYPVTPRGGDNLVTQSHVRLVSVFALVYISISLYLYISKALYL